MAISDLLLQRIFPEVGISKINVEGQDNNITLTIEVEKIRPFNLADNQSVKTAISIIETDQSISSINNYQSLFEQSVKSGYGYLDVETSPQKEEKIIYREDKKFLSKTFSATKDLDIQNLNMIIFYGSWTQDLTTGAYTFSKVKAEILFEDGKIKSESYIYLLPGKEDVVDRIWEGQVKRSEDKLSFVTDEPTPRLLERVVTKNYKVQDFRTKKQLEKIVSDYQDINNAILNTRSRQLVKTEPSRKKYFTDSYISQKYDLSLLFGFNYRDAILDNSILGKDPGLSSTLRNELVSKSKITKLQFVRRRVFETGKNNNPLSDIRKTVEPFPRYFEEEIGTGKDAEGEFTSSEYIKENKSVIKNFENKMRFFSCIDTEAVSSQGLYQYGVKVQIMDGSYKIITQDIEELQNNKVILQEAYNDLEVFVNTEANIQIYTEQQIEQYVKLYLEKLKKYYDLKETDEIENKLISQLSPVNLSPDSLDNFIKLYDSLISSLQNMIGEKASHFDDPHTEEATNTEKNTNSTFEIEHYFGDNVYDTSLANMKKVEYLPENRETFFNEYNFSTFSVGNRKQVTKNSIGVLIDTTLSPLAIHYKTATKVIDRTERKEYGSGQQQQFDKIIRENLLRHINIEINKAYLKQQEIEEKDYFDEQKAEIYKYFSSTNVSNKEIDEVFDLFEQYKDDFLAKMQYLQDFDPITGIESWVDLTSVVSEKLINGNGQIFCRLKTLREDYRSTKWNISEQIKAIDMFFVLKVDSLEDINKSYFSFYNLNTAPVRTNNTTIKTLKEDKKQEITLQDAQTEPTQRSSIEKQEILIDRKATKEKVKSKAEKVKKSTRNWVING